MKYPMDIVDAIVEKYPEFDTPSDQLLTDRTTLDAFAEAVNTRAGSNLSSSEVAQAMVYARKRGLLSRLRRSG